MSIQRKELCHLRGDTMNGLNPLFTLHYLMVNYLLTNPTKPYQDQHGFLGISTT